MWPLESGGLLHKSGVLLTDVLKFRIAAFYCIDKWYKEEARAYSMITPVDPVLQVSVQPVQTSHWFSSVYRHHSSHSVSFWASLGGAHEGLDWVPAVEIHLRNVQYMHVYLATGPSSHTTLLLYYVEYMYIRGGIARVAGKVSLASTMAAGTAHHNIVHI